MGIVGWRTSDMSRAKLRMLRDACNIPTFEFTIFHICLFRLFDLCKSPIKLLEARRQYVRNWVQSKHLFDNIFPRNGNTPANNIIIINLLCSFFCRNKNKLYFYTCFVLQYNILYAVTRSWTVSVSAQSHWCAVISLACSIFMAIIVQWKICFADSWNKFVYEKDFN